jgi:hypothetical protein
MTSRALAADLSARAIELLGALRAAASHDQPLYAAQLGATLTQRALALELGRKSVAGWIRERMRGDPTPLREAVASAARAAELRRSGSPCVDAAAVAAHFAITLEEVLTALRTRAGRRAFGWPMHVAPGVWRFDSAITTPARASYLAVQPEIEPGHLAPLPAGFEA